MINGSVSVNITRSGLLDLYIGRLPGKDEISHCKQLYSMARCGSTSVGCFAADKMFCKMFKEINLWY